MKTFLKKIPGFRHLAEMSKRLENMESMLARTTAILGKLEKVIIEESVAGAMQQKRYASAHNLNRYEYQVFSQNGEDGIIQEIFRRIGTTNQYFVEFGASDGLENNTTSLLVRGWKGLWIELSDSCFKAAKGKFESLIRDNRLTILNEGVSPDNIEALFKKAGVPEQFDFLSIDIDGNDYWVWKAIKTFRPRVVAIEYNGIFRPDMKWVMEYNANHGWNTTSYHGASLKSLEALGLEKDYHLVGTDMNGVNAFFVQKDWAREKFEAPFTAEHHYHPSRFHLIMKAGHKRDFGPFERI